MDAEGWKKSDWHLTSIPPDISTHEGSHAFARKPETITQIATRMRLAPEKAKDLAVLGGELLAFREVHRREVGWASLVVEGIQEVETGSLAEGLQVQAAGKACLQGEGAGVR